MKYITDIPAFQLKMSPNYLSKQISECMQIIEKVSSAEHWLWRPVRTANVPYSSRDHATAPVCVKSRGREGGWLVGHLDTSPNNEGLRSWWCLRRAGLQTEGLHWESITSCLLFVHPKAQPPQSAAQHRRKVTTTQCSPSACRLAVELHHKNHVVKR